MGARQRAGTSCQEGDRAGIFPRDLPEKGRPGHGYDLAVRSQQGFKKHGFKFVLAGVDYTKNKKWFTRCHKNKFERQMKQALLVDTTKNLNVYTCRPAGGILGFASFPKASGAWRDGITLLYSSLPGGSAVPYNSGDTVTHEAVSVPCELKGRPGNRAEHRILVRLVVRCWSSAGHMTFSTNEPTTGKRFVC